MSIPVATPPQENRSAKPSIQMREPAFVTVVRLADVRLISVIAQIPAQVLLGLLWLYQRTLSPVLPVVFGPSCGCRFAPTCSHYATEAIRTHGAVFGFGLALRRLVKCTPLHPGGFDPVPPPASSFSCVRFTKTTPVEG